MQEILDKIKDSIKDPMEKMGIIVCDINYVTENKYHFLKITLDKVMVLI